MLNNEFGPEPIITTAFDNDWPFPGNPTALATSTPAHSPTTEPAAQWPTAVRDERMAEMAIAGATLQGIGTKFGVTRERVRQVLMKRYGITGQDMRVLRRAIKAEQLANDKAKVLAWTHTNPGRTLTDASIATGVPAERIKEALSREALRANFAPTRPKHQPRFTDDAILTAIRAAAVEHGDPLSSSRYDEYAAEHGTPTACRIIQRFGTWAAACSSAGVRAFTCKRKYARRWTPGDMVDAVVAYLSSPGATGTFADYDRWARTEPDHPSRGTVRNQFGSWTAVKTAAMASARRPAA